MKVRITQNFGCYERGQVFEDWPGGMCEILIGRGLIEQVKEDVAVEVADASPVVETAEAAPRRVSKKAK